MKIIEDIRKRHEIQDNLNQSSGLVTITWSELNKSEQDSSDQSFDAA